MMALITQKLFYCGLGTAYSDHGTAAKAPASEVKQATSVDILAEGVEATERLTSFEHSGTMYMCLSVN